MWTQFTQACINRVHVNLKIGYAHRKCEIFLEDNILLTNRCKHCIETRIFTSFIVNHKTIQWHFSINQIVKSQAKLRQFVLQSIGTSSKIGRQKNKTYFFLSLAPPALIFRRTLDISSRFFFARLWVQAFS